MRTDVFHEGEIAVQARAGERAIAVRNGAMLRATITGGALPFLAQQRTVAIALQAADGRLWASLWFGHAGFFRSPDGQTVTITRDVQCIGNDDPVWTHLRRGSQLGLLAIELGSRRRLRINGVVSTITGDVVTIEVREVFPNCPKYIQRRQLQEAQEANPATNQGLRRSHANGAAIDDERRALIEATDTLFVASQHVVRGVDVSHRGGASGFVRVLDEHTLRIPDYPGNSMFQTLGNFEIDGRASVVITDFRRGRLLSITGSARLRFGPEDPQQPTAGTGRYWELAVERWIEHAMPARYRWQLLDASPFNPPPFAGAGTP